MRQTRNLVVGSILLLVGLFFTGAHMFVNAGSTPNTRLAANIAISEGERVIPDQATIPEKESRDSFITSMKRELAKRVDKIVVPISVANEAVVETETTDDTNSAAKVREVVWCDATVLEAQFVAGWFKEVNVEVREGARVVVATAPALETASGTIEQDSITIMQLPLRPVLRSEPACLTNGYIGVTPDGRLIHNNDVILYKTYSAAALIGYAFDGNPIYGVTDEIMFDSCGGQKTVSGYQYNLRADENFILGCFKSEPQQLMLAG